LESGPFNPIEHAYVLWDLILFEPWFIIEGILLHYSADRWLIHCNTCGQVRCRHGLASPEMANERDANVLVLATKPVSNGCG